MFLKVSLTSSVVSADFALPNLKFLLNIKKGNKALSFLDTLFTEQSSTYI